jgi:asparagine N-glycosylation enzyme membrane subunit Stt3
MRLKIGLTTFVVLPFLGFVLSLSSAINNIRPLAIVGFATIFVLVTAGLIALAAAPAIGAWLGGMPRPKRTRDKEPAW